MDKKSVAKTRGAKPESLLIRRLRGTGALLGLLVGLPILIYSAYITYDKEIRFAEHHTLTKNLAVVSEAQSRAIDHALDGRLVRMSGPTSAGKGLVDDVFDVGSANALRLSRTVKTYQWVEEDLGESKVGADGKAHRFAYSMKWSEKLIDSAEFQEPQGHKNPYTSAKNRPAIRQFGGLGPDGLPAGYKHPSESKSFTFENPEAMLGAYKIGQGSESIASRLTNFVPLALDPSLPQTQHGFRLVGQEYYLGLGSMDAPHIGDKRISFSIVPAEPATVVGYVKNGSLFSYIGVGQIIGIATHGADAASASRATQPLEEWTSQLNRRIMEFRPTAFLTCLFGFILLSASVAGAYRLIYRGDGIGWPSIIIFAVMGATATTLLADALAWIDHWLLLSFALTALAAIIFILLEKLRGNLTSRKPRAK